MKIVKKLVKWFLILLVGVLSILALADAAWVYGPPLIAQQRIEEVGHYAKKIGEIRIPTEAKIIGLGEASHGNVEFQELKLDLLKTLVQHEQVRSFALEMDVSEGLIIDRYIHGGEGKARDIVKNLSFTIYRTQQMQDLIEWMRSYNADKPEGQQLSFYGFDIQNPEKGIDPVLEYCQQHKILAEEDLAGALQPIKDTSKKLSDEQEERAKDLLKQVQAQLETTSQTSESQLISHVITNILAAFDYYKGAMSDYVAMNNVRDEDMAKNVVWIQSFEEAKGQERILIAGHNGHVAYKDRLFTSMGSRLKAAYHQGYFAIGTDYFETRVNISEVGKTNVKRSNHSFQSADPLAAQASYMGGVYYLDFASVKAGSKVQQILSKPMSMGSLGEGYSFLMHLLPTSHRIQAVPTELYDAMIFVYKAQPIQPWEK